MTASPSPSALKINPARDQLTVEFTDAAPLVLSAEYLRVFSPSAEVQGHSPDQKVTVGGKQAVQIMQVLPVGNYAVRIVFDDMHSSGIYSWTTLKELAAAHAENWAGYLQDLQHKGLKRTP